MNKYKNNFSYFKISIIKCEEHLQNSNEKEESQKESRYFGHIVCFGEL